MPASSVPVEHTGALTNEFDAIDANAYRIGIVVSNNSDTVMTVRIGEDDASANDGIAVPPHTAMVLKGEFCPTDRLTVFCSGANKSYTAYEWSN